MYGTDETVFHFMCPRTKRAVTYTKVYRCTTSHAEGWQLVDYRCSALMSERCRVPYRQCPQYEPLADDVG
jgi:hypothetical protein